LWCWGHNERGQVTTPLSGPVLVPTRVAGSEAYLFVEVSAGDSHACARTVGGRVFCWGTNDQGAIGAGLPTDAVEPDYQLGYMPIAVAGVEDARALVGGTWHHCARRASGAPWCWGWNLSGELGLGPDPTIAAIPMAVSILASVDAIAAGDGHTCARRGEEVFCWGYNVTGAVGDGTVTNRFAPRPVDLGGRSVTALDAGGTPIFDDHAGHTCVIADGTVWCWGDDTYGQVGDGGALEVAVSDPVDTGFAADAIALGGRHTCALQGGRVTCWGRASEGQLGDAASSRAAPGAPLALEGVTRVFAGGFHSCALVGSDELWCWGAGADGQLGDGGMTLRNPDPQRVLFPD